MVRTAAALAAALLLGLSAVPARADEIADRLSDARSKYEAGDLGAAAQDLAIALNAIQKAQGDAYAKTMPAPPSGWTATEPTTESTAMMGGGVSVQRTYSREDGEGEVQASVVADNPMAQGMMAMLTNPMLMASQPNTKVAKINGLDAVVEWRPDDKGGQVTATVAGRIVIQIQGSNVASAEAMTGLLKAWDLAALKKAAGI